MSEWSEDRIRVAYDDVADTYADHLRGTEAEAPLELAMIDHFVGLLEMPRQVLDAGCGAGRMMPYLDERGCQVQGVDLSAGMVRRARRDHPGFPVVVGSLTALPLPDGCVDGYFSWYSSIHTSDGDLPVIVSEARRVLRPCGVALFAFQTGDGVCDASGAYRDRGHDVELLRHRRSLDVFSGQVEAAGFTIVASMQRAAAGAERDGQAVVIGCNNQRTEGP